MHIFKYCISCEEMMSFIRMTPWRLNQRTTFWEGFETVYSDRIQDFDLSLTSVWYCSQILVFKSQDIDILNMIFTTSAWLLENLFSSWRVFSSVHPRKRWQSEEHCENVFNHLYLLVLPAAHYGLGNGCGKRQLNWCKDQVDLTCFLTKCLLVEIILGVFLA